MIYALRVLVNESYTSRFDGKSIETSRIVWALCYEDLNSWWLMPVDIKKDDMLARIAVELTDDERIELQAQIALGTIADYDPFIKYGVTMVNAVVYTWEITKFCKVNTGPLRRINHGRV